MERMIEKILSGDDGYLDKFRPIARKVTSHKPFDGLFFLREFKNLICQDRISKELYLRFKTFHPDLDVSLLDLRTLVFVFFESSFNKNWPDEFNKKGGHFYENSN